MIFLKIGPQLVSKCLHGLSLSYLSRYHGCGTSDLQSGRPHLHTQTQLGNRSFALVGPQLWYLPVELRQRVMLERVQATTEDVFVSLRLGAL